MDNLYDTPKGTNPIRDFTPSEKWEHRTHNGVTYVRRVGESRAAYMLSDGPTGWYLDGGLSGPDVLRDNIRNEDIPSVHEILKDLSSGKTMARQALEATMSPQEITTLEEKEAEARSNRPPIKWLPLIPAGGPWLPGR
jgi:hypothetical protein